MDVDDSCCSSSIQLQAQQQQHHTASCRNCCMARQAADMFLQNSRVRDSSASLIHAIISAVAQLFAA
jgi:hypothetical protein